MKAIGMMPCTDGWQVVTRDVLGAGVNVERVVFWVLVSDDRQGFGVIPMVLRDGQLAAAQGKLQKFGD
jgi:hypothetical protein